MGATFRWKWASVGHPREVELVLDVDGEGVVRVVHFTGREVSLTPKELGMLLTALVKAVCSTSAGDETVEVTLN